ncbi:MAG: FAD-dependent oxidoreductase [Fimbriimonadales bacterium]
MSGSTRLRVAVVGCGIGGPAAALFLARSGHEVTVFDRAEELGPKGAGILLAPTGQYVLDELGLLDAALAHSSIIQRLAGQSASGRKVMDIRYRNLHPGLFGLGIHRGALFAILRDAMIANGIEIRTGWPLAGVDEGYLLPESGVTSLDFGVGEGSDSKLQTPNSKLQTQESQYPQSAIRNPKSKEGPFDLIVVADGVRSTLRKSLGLEIRAKPYGYGAIWASVTNWGEFPDNVLQQAYKGTRKMIGLLPSGRIDGVEGRQISIFWSIPFHQLPLWRLNGLDRWKEDVLQLMPGIESLLDQIESPDQVTIASYFDVRTRAAVSDRCVLIGDSAHASSPQLGQGASLALSDAMKLAKCLDQEPDLAAALSRYQASRRRQSQFYQAASKWMTPFFQSSCGALAWPRDLLLGPLCRWPWLQREMVATMCGFKDGPFGRIAEENQITQMSMNLTLGRLVRDSSPTETAPSR